MTKAEADKIPLGIYRVWWKSGGASVAAIGMQEDGSRWLAPTNWVYPADKRNNWHRQVSRLELIPVNHYMPQEYTP